MIPCRLKLLLTCLLLGLAACSGPNPPSQLNEFAIGDTVELHPYGTELWENAQDVETYARLLSEGSQEESEREDKIKQAEINGKSLDIPTGPAWRKFCDFGMQAKHLDKGDLVLVTNQITDNAIKVRVKYGKLNGEFGWINKRSGARRPVPPSPRD